MTEYAALCISPTCRPANPRRAQPHAHVCDTCEDKLRTNLYAIENTWDDLQAALMRGSSDPTAERVKGSKAVGLVINETASDAIHAATDVVWFVARLVVDERGVKCGGANVPKVAHWLAFAHVPWIVRHHDPDLVTAIIDDIDTAQKAVHRAAYPKGARRVDITELTCQEHTTTAAGERTPCTGHMYLIAVPDSNTWPDLTCSVDPTHKIGPDMWRREAWHRRKMNPAAASALVRSITG